MANSQIPEMRSTDSPAEQTAKTHQMNAAFRASELQSHLDTGKRVVRDTLYGATALAMRSSQIQEQLSKVIPVEFRPQINEFLTGVGGVLGIVAIALFVGEAYTHIEYRRRKPQASMWEETERPSPHRNR